MKNASQMIVQKLTEIAIEKGYNPAERGKLKELALSYLQKVGFKSNTEIDKEKELLTLYRTLKNFFSTKMQFTSSTFDKVIDVLGIMDIKFEYPITK